MPSPPPSRPSCCSGSAGLWAAFDAGVAALVTLSPRTLRCTRSSKRSTLTTTRSCVPPPIGLDLVVGFDAEFYGAAFDADDLGGGSHAQADRRRRDVADVEMDAEALMAGRQEVLDGGERSRLDDVDHHRCRQHRDAARADERRGMFGADHDLGRAGEAGRDPGQDRADAGRGGHGTLWPNMA